MRIIDCHTHLGTFPPATIGCADAAAMVRAMDAAGVEQACCSSFLGIGPDARAGNALVAAAMREFPGRFVGYATVNPNRPGEIRDELRRCFDDSGMAAIKLHPATHRYPIQGPAWRPVFEFAAERRAAILSHEWGTPAWLEALSREFPQVPFLVAHTGFWDGRGEFAWEGVLRSRPNVFLDLAYSNIYYEALERMVERAGAEKILWGSDFPLHDLGYQLGRVLFSKLPEEHRRMVLGENMLRILEGSWGSSA